MKAELLSVGNLDDKYMQLDVLGKGSYALVRRCRHRETGAVHAVKHITKHDAFGEERVGADELNAEIAVIAAMGVHPKFARSCA